jgi:hypothetical protein
MATIIKLALKQLTSKYTRIMSLSQIWLAAICNLKLENYYIFHSCSNASVCLVEKSIWMEWLFHILEQNGCAPYLVTWLSTLSFGDVTIIFIFACSWSLHLSSYCLMIKNSKVTHIIRRLIMTYIIHIINPKCMVHGYKHKYDTYNTLIQPWYMLIMPPKISTCHN